MSFAIGLLLLSLLIAVHEAGHMLVAKFFNVKVEVFSLGIGPKLFGVQLGETEYRISVLPFGGYVKMLGQDGAGTAEEEIDPEELERSMEHVALWKRSLIIAAGPVTNLVFAVLLAVIGFMGGTVLPSYTFDPVQIESVAAGSPAEQSGFLAGDLVVGINYQPIENWSVAGKTLLDMRGSEDVPFQILRGKEKVSIAMDIPDKFDDRSMLALGFDPGKEGKIRLRLPWYEAIPQSLSSFYQVTKIFMSSMYRAITFKASKDEIGGPVSAVKAMGESVTDQQSSFGRWLILTGVISFQLGLFNLVPIYPLDGAHLLGYLWLAVVRRPPGKWVGFTIRNAGAFVMISLVVVLLIKDFGLL